MVSCYVVRITSRQVRNLGLDLANVVVGRLEVNQLDSDYLFGFIV